MIDPVGYHKTAIITGCSSGMGLETTLLFLSHQYQVFGIDLNPFDYKLLEALENGAHQEHFHFHQANLMQEKAVEESVAICVQTYGPKIDVLINNAGIMDSFAAADTYTDAMYSRVIAINLTAPLQLMRAVLPFMKSPEFGGTGAGGAIVNLCSKASLSGATAGIAYTASKHGLLGATKHTAWRFKDSGIRCNAVLPGSVGTNISSSIDFSAIDGPAYATLQSIHALNAAPGTSNETTTKDIANAVLFLASDAARSISGVALPVDQAWSTI